MDELSCLHAHSCLSPRRRAASTWPLPHSRQRPLLLPVKRTLGFVTAQARCIDLATVLAQESGALLLVSPRRREELLARMDKYIFPGDKARLFFIF